MDRHHWFFDLDGTLARTGEDIIAAWKRSLADLGRVCPRFDEVFTIGPTLEKVVYELFDDASPELVAQLVGRFRPNYDESGFPNTVPYPGVPERLAALKAAGAKLYIVTNKRHVPTQLIVRKLDWDRLFDGVWSYDSFPGVKYKKPDLLAYLLVIFVVDYSGDPSYNLSLLVLGEPVLSLADLESPVFFRRKRVHVHGHNLRDKKLVVFVEIVRKTSETPKSPLVSNFLNGYRHIFFSCGLLIYEFFLKYLVDNFVSNMRGALSLIPFKWINFVTRLGLIGFTNET